MARSPARLMKGGGQKKGDFSHLGEAPPLPAVPITVIDCKDRIYGRKVIHIPFCVRNLSTYGTVLRAEPFCARKCSACGTILLAKPFCMRNRCACGTVLPAEPFCMRNKWNPKSRRVYIGRYIYRSACGTFLPAEHCKELRSPIDMHRNTSEGIKTLECIKTLLKLIRRHQHT